ncbi:cysteine--tRNA ligase [Desulfobacca acetoxidans]|uniref:Cysteine--tRNA ligase n=1 Tax=Desulfobacca acetoxidans (strain ATCC 700848 / DSM 11109 / ASRB2) TaxID=880072 RepID=F2NEG1_DESAR|nr:cysteine--tRNA ligase [Desulfobacca acetoxidans]AEB08151.1 cysteinyl-tRNA synthetase [Desulfobacca acetoxidans DSM 11109]
MQVYNTLSRRKEAFIPLKPGIVQIYACGVTVYDDCHIGHARSAVVFDVIVRYLRFLGNKVSWVRNFTDIDDKIIQRAEREHTSWKTVAETYIASFQRDMAALGVAPADIEPKATDHIDEIIGFIQVLEDQGLAYQRNGDVYFPVAKFPGYGKLSGRSLDDMLAGARVDVNIQKDNPFDFALWKASKPGEPAWDSPWGPGRPGWHIECSAMSRHYLGETFDIHGGGADLIFPHHENEIAQSEAAHGKPLARYWLHNGMVTVNQEKMSKSLGNFFTIREVLAKFHPEVVRFFLIQNHYRSPLDFSDQALAEAENALERLYSTLARLDQTTGPIAAPEAISGAFSLSGLDSEEQSRLLTIRSRFLEAMDDDFNTAQALGVLFDAVRLLNRIVEHNPSGNADMSALAWTRRELTVLGGILNLLQQDPQTMLQNLRQKTDALTIPPSEIERLIAARAEARKQRDFTKADAIRQQLAEAGVLLEDTPQGAVWRVKI